MRFSSILCTALIWHCLSGQDLVPNPGFEEFVNCPNDFLKQGQIFSLPGWYSPNTGTPDYFNECGDGECNASANWAGICRDHFGKGYAGIISFMTIKNYREYLATELLTPLDSGVAYFLQFRFRLSSYSLISSGNLGMGFSENKIVSSRDDVIKLFPCLTAMKDSAIVMRTGNWQQASGTYVANGSERYLIIGNFKEHTANQFFELKFGGDNEPMLRRASYYYIDDVVVRRQVESGPETIFPLIAENPFADDSLITLRNVQFSYNSATLSDGSEGELDRLIIFLRSNPSASIEIRGHTDDQGTDEYNNQLSVRRAREVMAYIEKGGVPPEQMVALGFGKTSLLINGIDENARRINRRVEVRLVR
jgi:OmpA-OmpF porin, OOP family